MVLTDRLVPDFLNDRPVIIFKRLGTRHSVSGIIDWCLVDVIFNHDVSLRIFGF